MNLIECVKFQTLPMTRMHSRREFYRKYLIIQYCLAAVVTLIILYSFTRSAPPTTRASRKHVLEEYNHIVHFERKGSINILVKTPVSWIASFNEEQFRRRGCPVYNCHFTRDSTHLASISDFDAVFFIARGDLETRMNEVKSYRTPEQTYIILLSESPDTIQKATRIGNFNWDNKFNMTISYRLDSDSIWEYGGFIDKVTNEKISPAFQPKWRYFDLATYNDSFVVQSEIPEVVAGKEKLAAWFVSNCKFVSSKRMKLAQAIQKYIALDIYGNCGPLKCRGNAACREMLNRDYKFYLSFENSLCPDYITEKVFMNMMKTIIPVIYNGADANRFLPPHSYINVEDFATIKDLTDYMLFLADNPEEYMSYFWWKEYYYISGNNFYCDMCKNLNERVKGQQHMVHSDLQSWYFKDACRVPKMNFNLNVEDEENVEIFSRQIPTNV